MATHNLPEDLVIHILSWLPVMSLMRFKCVCKSWRSLIESPNFIAQHLNHATWSNNHGNGTRLVMRRRDPMLKEEFSLLCDGTFEVSKNFDLPDICEKWNLVRLSILACCNGIICLSDSPTGLTLWNPATRELKAIPESCLPLPPGMKSSLPYIGFGFDLKTNDYKLVKIFDLMYEISNLPVNRCHVELYSLSSDSWRLIDFALTCIIRCDYRSSIYVNGFYSWVGCDGFMENDFKEEILVSFDMSNEVFLRTMLPAVCAPTTDVACRCISLAVLNESIALFAFHLFQFVEEDYPEIWVLNEFGVKGSWTKLYTFGPILIHRWCPLGFSKNGELFVEEWDGDYEQKLFLFNPFTQEKRNLQLDAVDGSLHVIVYVESLVPIKGGNAPNKRKI